MQIRMGKIVGLFSSKLCVFQDIDGLSTRLHRSIKSCKHHNTTHGFSCVHMHACSNTASHAIDKIQYAYQIPNTKHTIHDSAVICSPQARHRKCIFSTFSPVPQVHRQACRRRRQVQPGPVQPVQSVLMSLGLRWALGRRRSCRRFCSGQ